MVKDKDFYKTLLKIALPMALQSLISLGVVMADNIMIGALGDNAVSSVAQANQVTLFFTFFMRGISGSAAIMIAQYWGKKDMPRIKSIFGIIFQICLVITLIVTGIVYFFPDAVMSVLTNEQSVIDGARDYITVVCFSYVLYAVSDAFISMLRCVEVVKLTMYISIISLITNIFFNYAMIFGNFGFPEMGIRGAAYATVIARAVELSVVTVYFFCIQKRVKMSPFDLFITEKVLWGDFAKYGLPILIGDIQWGLVGVFRAMIIGRLGETMISANSITDTVMQLGMLFTSGLSGAACVIIGKAIGQKDYKNLRSYSNTIQIIFVGVGAIMGALVFIFRGFPVSLYNVSQETKALAVQLLAVGAFSLIGSSYHAACFTGINRGAGDSKFVFNVDMICGWLVVLPVSFLSAFVFKFPLPVVFFCTKIDQFFKWIIALIRLKGDKWIHSIVRE